MLTKYAYSLEDLNEVKPYLDLVQNIIESQNNPGKNEQIIITSLLSVLKKKGDSLYSISGGKHEPVYVHSIDVRDLACGLTEYLKNCDIIGFSDSIKKEIESISLNDISKVALLHDIGKLAILSRILLKEGKLTEYEKEIIRLHPIVGAYLISQIKCLENIIGGVKYHHEWYGDGKNDRGFGPYPGELKGEAIPLSARIISLADSYDALTSDRCYRKKKTPEEAISELRKGNGIRFDPKLFDLFLDHLNSIIH